MKDNEDLGYSLHMNSLEALSVKQGTLIEGTKYAHRFDNDVAVIDLIGPIYPRANMMTSSGATSVAQFASDYVRTYTDPDVRAVVTRIDSPGGDVRGIGDAAALINNITSKGKKPSLVFADGFMASAAYWLGSAMGAGNLRGSETSLTGSIGAVMTAKAKSASEIEIVSSQSPYKRVDAGTEEGASIIQQQVDDIASVFIGHVAKFRGISTDKVLSDYGQGKCLVGPRAKKHGLIDKIGTLASTVEEAAKMGTNNKAPLRHRAEAIEGEHLSILHFTEEDTMGLKDLINKFKASDETVLDEKALDASNEAEESGTTDDASTASVAPEATIQDTVMSREEYEERYSDAAELFAVNLTTSNKIYPSQQAHAAGDLLNAKIDDAMFGGTIRFVDQNGLLCEGTREASVRARYEAMPEHSMTAQAIKAVKEGSIEAKVLAEVDVEKVQADGPISDERRRQLLGLSEQGQRALAAQK